MTPFLSMAWLLILYTSAFDQSVEGAVDSSIEEDNELLRRKPKFEMIFNILKKPFHFLSSS
jgi:hypothetical protein